MLILSSIMFIYSHRHVVSACSLRGVSGERMGQYASVQWVPVYYHCYCHRGCTSFLFQKVMSLVTIFWHCWQYYIHDRERGQNWMTQNCWLNSLMENNLLRMLLSAVITIVICSSIFQPSILSCKFSTSSSRLLKFYNNGEEAVKDIPDGAKLLVGGQSP